MEQVQATHLYREIHEQPEVLARLLSAARGPAADLAAAIGSQGLGHVVIAARGTSDNAARYAQYLLGAANGLVVALATPSLFTIYRRPPRLADSLVLGISQSGRSPDIVAVLAEGQHQGALTAAITNDPNSDLAAASHHVLELQAGEERSVAATKTYTAELAAIALLSVCLGEVGPERHSPQSDSLGRSAREEALDQVPQQVAQALDVEDHVARIAPRYRYMQSCVTVGRGYNYATAYELALKLKELTYTVVEPYSSADFLHGPLAMVQPGFPLIVIAPSGQMLPQLVEFIEQVQERGAEVVVISDDDRALAGGRVALRLPAGVPEWLSPLTAIVPGQLLALHLAHARDFDPDRPRALRKVTETR
jgi:glutamine---fructose-6-phosphate transaminase (isomerizing)